MGQDAAATEGMRVVATEEGRSWDLTKAKRGDRSGGKAGTVVQVLEDGKVFIFILFLFFILFYFCRETRLHTYLTCIVYDIYFA